MSTIIVEVSNDQTEWVEYNRSRTKIEDYQWIRTSDYVDRKWSLNQVENWVSDKVRAKTLIEYSTNGGISYLAFTMANDNARRVYALAQTKNYVVRAMSLTENQNYIPQPSNEKAQAFLNAGYNSGGEPRKVKEQKIKRWVTLENDIYGIKKSVPYDPGTIVCMVEQFIPMSLTIPNRNKVTLGPASIPLLKSPEVFGHVYELYPCQALTFNWRSVITAHRRTQAVADEWVWVESARSYDIETYNLSGRIEAMSVLSDKFYVDNGGKQLDKIGCKFLILRYHAIQFIESINKNGGYAVWLADKFEEAEVEKAGALESIMTVRDNLKDAIASRNADQLAKVLFETVEFRDKAIDELKDLNTVLAEARKVAIELISEEQDGSSTRSN